MLKKITSLSLILLAPFFFLGCGGDKEDKKGPKSVTIWWARWAPADGLQELGKEFQKETGIEIKVQQIPWSSYQTQVFLNFGNKKTDFDIVVGDSQWIGRGSKGLYLELTDWLKKHVDVSSIHPRARKYLCEYPAGSGKFFAAPCETDAVGFAYRKDWFENPAYRAAFKKRFGKELGIPDTWKDFNQIAQFFHNPDKKRYGCAVLTGRGYDSLTMGFQQVMWSYGGSWGDEKTFKTAGFVDSAASAKALGFFKSLLSYAPNGAQNFDYGKCLESFTNGSTAMVMNYFAFYPGIVNKMGDKAGFFMMPKHGENRVISLGGQGFSISKKVSKGQQDLAKQFIAWFLKRENQLKWVQKDAGFTANVEILKSDAFRKATPYNAAFADSMDHLKDFWNLPSYNELLAVAQKKLGEALDGVKSPEQALKEIAGEHQKILDAR